MHTDRKEPLLKIKTKKKTKSFIVHNKENWVVQKKWLISNKSAQTHTHTRLYFTVCKYIYALFIMNFWCTIKFKIYTYNKLINKCERLVNVSPFILSIKLLTVQLYIQNGLYDKRDVISDRRPQMIDCKTRQDLLSDLK